MPTNCPPGLPQAACDLATALATAAQVNQPNPGWDANDVLSTFMKWYGTAATAKGLPPVLPMDPTAFGPGSLPEIVLKSAVDFWKFLGTRDPADARMWDLTAFPWQFAPMIAQDIPTMIHGALTHIMADPLARAYLSSGHLPPFDPTKIDWSLIANSARWPDNVIQAMPGAATIVQTFLIKGQRCNLFTQPVAVVQNAWVQYMTFGGNPSDPRGDPCVVMQAPTQPIQPSQLPPSTPTTPPTGPMVPVKDTKAAPLPIWVPIVLTAAGVGLAGALIYILTRPTGARSKPSSAALIGPGSKETLAENLIRPRRRRRRRRSTKGRES